MSEEDRIAKGIEVTRETIRARDAAALRKCLQTFENMGASLSDIYLAIADCPLELFKKVGAITIQSDVDGREITLGGEISWDAVQGLIGSRADEDAVKAVIEVSGTFGQVTGASVANLDLFGQGG